MSDIELELNTLRSIIAKQDQALTNNQTLLNQQKAMLDSLQARIAETRTKSDIPELILSALKTDGHLTVAQIVARCNLTKSQVWHNVWKLERDGAVWIRHRKDHKTGRSYDEIYHADAIVT